MPLGLSQFILLNLTRTGHDFSIRRRSSSCPNMCRSPCPVTSCTGSRRSPNGTLSPTHPWRSSCSGGRQAAQSILCSPSTGSCPLIIAIPGQRSVKSFYIIQIVCMIRWTAVTTLPSLLTASHTHFSECSLMGFLSVSLSPWRPFSQTGEENEDETKYFQSDPEQHAAPPASQCPPATWAWDSPFSSQLDFRYSSHRHKMLRCIWVKSTFFRYLYLV